MTCCEYRAVMQHRRGGATRAFHYAQDRRMHEIQSVLGFLPYPGTLNLVCDVDFDWSEDHYSAVMLDVVNRRFSLSYGWAPRRAGFWPVLVSDVETTQPIPAFAFRFENEVYPKNLLELVAPERLRDRLVGPDVLVCHVKPCP